MWHDKVWVVGFEWAGPESDDCGIECICDTRAYAEELVAKRNSEYPNYKFSIWGDYPVLTKGIIEC